MRIAHFALAGLIAAASLPAHAGSTIFSENFSGAVPGYGYTGHIGGTQFDVTTADVDVVGVTNGSFFTCSDNPAGNCLDLVGGHGAGGITSTTKLGLVAGDTYTVHFGARLQGFNAGQGSTTFSVGLGSLSQVETLVGGINTAYSLVFKPLANQIGAALSFDTIIPGDQVHGAVIDNISIVQSAPAVSTPEPAALALLAFGATGLATARRRSR